MGRIQKVCKAKNEIATNTESLIRSIERAFKQVSEQLDAIINSYIELHKRQKFCGSKMPIIEKIESFDINIKTFRIDEITSKVQDAYSVDLISYEKIVQNGVSQFLSQHNGGFKCGAITGDCQTLVTGGCDSVIRVWDLVQKRQMFMLLGHNSVVSCIALTGDEQYTISGSYDASVRVWNLQQKSQIAVLKGHKGGVLSICYLENQF